MSEIKSPTEIVPIIIMTDPRNEMDSKDESSEQESENPTPPPIQPIMMNLVNPPISRIPVVSKHRRNSLSSQDS